LNSTFCLERIVTQERAGSFLDASFRLFDSALQLIFVHTRVLLKADAGKPPAPAI